MFLKLLTKSHSIDTSTPDPDDKWDRASTSTTWDVLGIQLSSVDHEHALKADFDVNPGDIVQVLYAVYSSGDSFGHDEGYSLEVLSFHKNGEVAQKNLRSITGARESYRMVIETDSGGRSERCCHWDGYFEHLNQIEIQAFLVQPEPWPPIQPPS